MGVNKIKRADKYLKNSMYAYIEERKHQVSKESLKFTPFRVYIFYKHHENDTIDSNNKHCWKRFLRRNRSKGEKKNIGGYSKIPFFYFTPANHPFVFVQNHRFRLKELDEGIFEIREELKKIGDF